MNARILCRTIGSLAAATAVGGLLGPAASAAPASAAPAGTPASAGGRGSGGALAFGGSAAAWAPVSSRVDVDGDGRGDRSTLRHVATTRTTLRYVLTVVGSRGRTASLPISISNEGVAFTPRDMWRGASGFDGVRGNEILLDLGSGVGDSAWLHTYTWRGGKIVNLAAPGSTNRARSWILSGPPFGIYGYTFSMRGSTRQVAVDRLEASPSRRTYSGTRTLYRWGASGWQRVGVGRIAAQPTATAERRHSGFHGLIWR